MRVSRSEDGLPQCRSNVEQPPRRRALSTIAEAHEVWLGPRTPGGGATCVSGRFRAMRARTFTSTCSAAVTGSRSRAPAHWRRQECAHQCAQTRLPTNATALPAAPCLAFAPFVCIDRDHLLQRANSPAAVRL